MLKTQQFLLNNNLDFNLLTSEYAIKVNPHQDGRVILNYNQIDSPKENPIVMECRALVLDKQAKLVARSFPRFFNWGETNTRRGQFDFNNCWAEEKHDGSLVLIYYYQDKWRINTRNSFACDNEWRPMIEMALPQHWENLLHKEQTYIFEFCSPFNQVVRFYPKPTLYLLSIFEEAAELSYDIVDAFSHALRVHRPRRFSLNSIEKAISYIEDEAAKEKTFEGVVLRDIRNRRWKIKNPFYLQLHKVFSNKNWDDKKNLIPFVLRNEVDELLTYFPQVSPSIEEIRQNLENSLAILESRAKMVADTDDKTFALAIKDLPLAPLAFAARKRRVPIKNLLLEFEQYLVKALDF